MMLNRNLRSSLESRESLRWTSALFICCNFVRAFFFHDLELIYSQVARHPDAVSVVTGIVGCAGLKVNFFSLSLSFLGNQSLCCAM